VNAVRQKAWRAFLSSLPWLLAPAMASIHAAAHAQGAFPERPVRLLVTVPPGGAVDLIARVLGKGLSDMWGQPVVIDNKPGAAGLVAGELLAKAPADGHTLAMMGDGVVVMRPFMQDKMPYDTLTDLVPVAIVARIPYVLIASPALKVRNVQELVSVARTRAGGIDYASSGTGGTHHVGMELFQRAAGISLNHVPYKGGAQALQDVVAGRVPVMWSAVSTAVPFVKEGKLVALAVGDLERSSLMPDVPTVAEAGIPKFDFSTWMGVMAPRGIPPALLERLNGDLLKVARSAAYRESLVSRGSEPATSTQREFAERVRTEYERNRVLFKSAGIKGD
jgi:tripartite-type tricarboxylate transporter receptor subunit TctC